MRSLIISICFYFGQHVGALPLLLIVLVPISSAQSVIRLPPPVPIAGARSKTNDSKRSIQLATAYEPVGLTGEPEDVPGPPAPIESGLPNSNVNPGRLIDLPSALQLAMRANPEIGISRQAIEEALARLQGARVLLLPSLTGGANYHQHYGNLQRSGGAIMNVPDEQAVYYGGGARTLGAQTVTYPAIQIFGHLGDAIYEPLAARQQTAVRQFDANATFNSVLLAVTTRYLDLWAAEARLLVLNESLRNAQEVVRITKNFAEVGQGRQADANRSSTEASLIASEVQRAQENVAIAAADLARLLNLDPEIPLRAMRGPLPLVQLVDPAKSTGELIEMALARRPELAARSTEIAEAETRYRQERSRPLFPTISVAFSAGDFGGGSNLTNPTFGNFAGRTDFDVLAFWTVQNFGAGNVAKWRQCQAQEGEAAASRIRTLNLIRREVAEANALSIAGRREVTVAEERLKVAESGLQEELRRIEAGEGLPIELIDSLTRAISARQAVVTAIAGYDRAQFQLFVALGQPPICVLPQAAALNVSAQKE